MAPTDSHASDGMVWREITPDVPKISETVLLSDGRCVVIGWRRDLQHMRKPERAHPWDFSGFMKPMPTHWMPLPEPPK